MKKVLIIPSQPYSPYLRIRLVEIAQLLSGKFEIYLVHWTVDLERHYLFRRIYSSLKDIIRKTSIKSMGSLRIVEFPMLHRPLYLAPDFNSFWLKKIIKREGIDLVINGSYYLFSIPRKREFKYIVDLADLPVEGIKSYFDRFIHERTKIELIKADAITVVSLGLVKYLSENYKLDSYLIPNGAYIDQLRFSNRNEDIEEVKKRYGVSGKWIIGYIGFIIGSWMDMEFLVSVFREIKKEISNAVLLLVGASPRLEFFRDKFSKADIIFTGAVQEDINKYFNCLDLAILPYKKTPYQDMAFHIKIIEYTAARKIVVSSPLDEILRLKFSNIIICPLDKAEWVKAIKMAYHLKWQPDWDKQVYDYDWKNVIDKLIEIIER